MNRSLPTYLPEVGGQFDTRGTFDMGMSGVSVKDAFLAVAKTDRYRNKWMPDLLWVDLIQKTFCSADPHFSALTKAKLN